LKVGVAIPNIGAITRSGNRQGDALGNAQRAELFEYHYQLAKLHQSTDRGEWWMDAANRQRSESSVTKRLEFPAAILQPPYFDVKADAAHNYGAMGAIIGHEISHSFDDQGSQFDAEGRMANWWTKEDFDHFKAAGDALARQFDTYRPFPDLAVNGNRRLARTLPMWPV